MNRQFLIVGLVTTLVALGLIALGLATDTLVTDFIAKALPAGLTS